MRSTQVVLPGFSFASKLSFGGDLQKGRRKSARVFDPKRALHVVLRSSQCTGASSLKKFERKISDVLSRQAELQGVKIYARANAGNHLHLVLKAPNRRALRRFLKAVTGLIARKVSGRERGAAAEPSKASKLKVTSKNLGDSNKHTSFWDARPFSRVVAWGKDFASLKNYLHLNRVEAIGFSRHESRGILDICKRFGLDSPIG